MDTSNLHHTREAFTNHFILSMPGYPLDMHYMVFLALVERKLKGKSFQHVNNTIKYFLECVLIKRDIIKLVWKSFGSTIIIEFKVEYPQFQTSIPDDFNIMNFYILTINDIHLYSRMGFFRVFFWLQ